MQGRVGMRTKNGKYWPNLICTSVGNWGSGGSPSRGRGEIWEKREGQLRVRVHLSLSGFGSKEHVSAAGDWRCYSQWSNCG